MQLYLNEKGPSIWYLGKPGAIKASLNFQNKGPIDLDFNDLGPDEQKQILFDMQASKIQVSESFETLYKIWLKNQPFIPQEEPPKIIQEYLQEKKNARNQNKGLKIQAEFEKKERKFKEKVKFLSQQQPQNLKSSLKDNKDIRLLKALKEKELERKRPRTSVMDLLNDHIKKIQYEICKDIDEKQLDNNSLPNISDPSVIRYNNETIKYSVVESESEIIEFTQEDLQKFAAGDVLGGE